MGVLSAIKVKLVTLYVNYLFQYGVLCYTFVPCYNVICRCAYPSSMIRVNEAFIWVFEAEGI